MRFLVVLLGLLLATDVFAVQETLYVRDNAACPNFNGDGSTSACATTNGGPGAFNGWFQVAFNASDETAHAVDPGDLVYICGAHTGGYFHGPADASGLGSGTSGNVVTVSFDCPGNPGSVTSDSATTSYAFGSYAKFITVVNPVATGGRETISISDSLADVTTVMNVTIQGGTVSDNTYANTNSKCMSLRGRNIVVTGVTVRNCWNDGIWAIGKGMEIKNNIISNVSNGAGNINGDCVQFSGEVDGVRIHDNYCDHTSVDAKYCYVSSGPTDNGYVAIYSNVCVKQSTDTVGDGILLQSSPGLIASNKIIGGAFGARCQPDAAEQCDMVGNLIIKPNFTGLQTGGSTTLSNIMNNTIVNPATSCIQIDTNQAGIIARDNICQGTATGIVKLTAGNAPIDSHNLFYQVSGNNLTVNGSPTGVGTGTISGQDPLFIGVGDYRLQPTSPARRTGLYWGPNCRDLRGRSCNFPPDMGAYQASTGDLSPARTVLP